MHACQLTARLVVCGAPGLWGEFAPSGSQARQHAAYLRSSEQQPRNCCSSAGLQQARSFAAWFQFPPSAAARGPRQAVVARPLACSGIASPPVLPQCRARCLLDTISVSTGMARPLCGGQGPPPCRHRPHMLVLALRHHPPGRCLHPEVSRVLEPITTVVLCTNPAKTFLQVIK